MTDKTRKMPCSWDNKGWALYYLGRLKGIADNLNVNAEMFSYQLGRLQVLIDDVTERVKKIEEAEQ